MYCHRRHRIFDGLFNGKNGLGVCEDVNGLMAALDIPYDPDDWRIFIDSSASSLKAVLLHNDNRRLPSVPIAFANDCKEESYEALKSILCSTRYDQYKWKICCDLKVIALLVGLQAGYTKYCCFICERMG